MRCILNNRLISSRSFTFLTVLAHIALSPAVAVESEQIDSAFLRGALIYNFAKQTTWQDQYRLDQFRIAILGEAPNLRDSLRSNLSDKTLKGLPVEIIQSDDLSQLGNVQILYLPKSSEDRLREVSSKLRKTNTLLITDAHPNKRNTMINLQPTEDNRIHFELNRPNIVYEGLMLSSEVLLLGGSELDVATLYREMEDELQSSKDLLESQTVELEEQSETIAAHNQLLEYQREELEIQKGQLAQQKATIDDSQKQLDKLAGDLVVKNRQLQEREIILAEQQHILLSRQKEIEQKEKEINKANVQITQNQTTLETQQLLIGKQLGKIERQSDHLSKQTSIIEAQKRTIFLTVVIVALLGAGAVLVYRNSKIRDRSNALLATKNEELKHIIEKLNTANTEIERAKEEADRANHSKTSFLANMSHEIRTPLNAIIGYSQILRRDHELTDQQAKSLRSINRSGNHLLSLINDILTMSKVESGKTAIKETSLNLDLLMEDLRSMFAIRATNKALNFNCKITPPYPKSIVSDKGKIRQVLINLLSNAFKFTRQGYVNLDVSCLNTSGSDYTISFKVSDSGKGIAPEDIDRIFHVFEQGISERGGTGGTGLGLAISKDFAQLLGGDITAESQEGKGSVFHFTIQAKSSDRVEDETNESQLPALYNVSKYSPNRALIVDDQEANLDVLQLTLQQSGLEVMATKRAKEALEIVKDWNPDVIITDIVMPEMDGEQFAIALAEQAHTKDIPVIGVTANILEREDNAALPQNMKALLGKPIDPQTLHKSIQTHSAISFNVVEDATQSSEQRKNESIAANELEPIPDQIAQLVLKAAAIGDMEEVQEYIKKLPSHHETAKKVLMAMAEDFALQDITRFVEINQDTLSKASH